MNNRIRRFGWLLRVTLASGYCCVAIYLTRFGEHDRLFSSVVEPLGLLVTVVAIAGSILMLYAGFSSGMLRHSFTRIGALLNIPMLIVALAILSLELAGQSQSVADFSIKFQFLLALTLLSVYIIYADGLQINMMLARDASARQPYT